MKKILKLSESIESKFSNLAREKNLKKQKIHSLGLGEPYFNTPKNISETAFDSILNGNTRYSNSFGKFELRRLISKKINSNLHINSNFNNILITPGSKFALYLALKSILQPNDKVLNFKPCYPSYEPQILLSEPSAKILNYDLEKNYDLDFRKLKKFFSNNIKAIIVNSPNNPTGKIFTSKELSQVLKLAKKNNSWIVFDSIYEDLDYLNNRVKIPMTLLNYKNFIYLGGFSKSFSMTGWRLGYSFTKNNILNYMNKINQHLITNIPVFIQDAGIEALKNNKKDIRNFNKTLKLNYNYLYSKLLTYKFRTPKFMGGMFVFLDISRYKLKSDIFCEKLLINEKVACTPGIFFGENWDTHIRISLSSDHQDFIKAIEKFFSFIDNLK
jgi:aspartate/methionine/tyrosine aminotransferase